jgi:hypothetical protein
LNPLPPTPFRHPNICADRVPSCSLCRTCEASPSANRWSLCIGCRIQPPRECRPGLCSLKICGRRRAVLFHATKESCRSQQRLKRERLAVRPKKACYFLPFASPFQDGGERMLPRICPLPSSNLFCSASFATKLYAAIPGMAARSAADSMRREFLPKEILLRTSLSLPERVCCFG